MTIADRIDAALEKARWQGAEVSSIYLTESDAREYDRHQSRKFRMKLVCLSYRDIEIRFGERSAVYLKGGDRISVAPRLSRRVA
jgi:hypothetical protein